MHEAISGKSLAGLLGILGCFLFFGFMAEGEDERKETPLDAYKSYLSRVPSSVEFTFERNLNLPDSVPQTQTNITGGKEYVITFTKKDSYYALLSTNNYLIGGIVAAFDTLENPLERLMLDQKYTWVVGHNDNGYWMLGPSNKLAVYNDSKVSLRQRMLEQPLPPKDFGEPLNQMAQQVRDLGIGGLRRGDLEWNQNEFTVRAGKKVLMKGSVSVGNNGMPKQVQYTLVPENQSFRVEYDYTAPPIGDRLPSRFAHWYLAAGKTPDQRVDFSIHSFKVLDEVPPPTVFTPDRFYTPSNTTILNYTNQTIITAVPDPQAKGNFSISEVEGAAGRGKKFNFDRLGVFLLIFVVAVAPLVLIFVKNRNQRKNN